MLRSSKTRFSPLQVYRRSMTSASRYQHRDISDGTARTNSQRRSIRGGQDLAHRWVRLEKSLREKAALSRGLEGLGAVKTDADASLHAPVQPLGKSKLKPVPLFYGFQVPEEPKPPADDECCMSGCAVCVYDLYEESLEAYNEAVAALRTSLSARHIPTAEWPAHVRPKESTPTPKQDSRKGAILDAFEEMERRLAAKKLEEGATTSVSNPNAHWKKRQELVAVKKAEARDSLLNEVYEAIRWVVFSSR